MNQDEWERRQRPRATGVVGAANVLVRGVWIDGCTVRDLSAGGAMLVGTVNVEVGDEIEVAFVADGDRLTGIALAARVVRCELLSEQRRAFGVVFRYVPGAIHDHIQELVALAIERRRAAAPPAILVVDDTRDAQRAIARDLGAGQKVITASTLLDVVRHLHDPELRIAAALVAARVGDADGVAILAHLAEDYPQIRRILMSDRTSTRDHEANMTSGYVQAFLTKPWDRECLLVALSAIPG